MSRKGDGRKGRVQRGVKGIKVSKKGGRNEKKGVMKMSRKEERREKKGYR